MKPNLHTEQLHQKLLKSEYLKPLKIFQKYHLAIVLVLLGAGAIYSSALNYYTAQRQLVMQTEETVGTLRPRVVSTLSSKVTGNVLEVTKREGDLVNTGDIVLRIEARDIGSDLTAAQAALSEAIAASGETEQHLASSESALTSAQSQEKLARDGYRRISTLFERKSATQQELDTAKNALTQAEQAVNRAQSQIAAIRARKAQVEAKTRQVKAQIAKISSIKDLSEVRAPFSGRVTKRLVEPGMLAAPGVPLLVIEDSERMQCEAIVPERLLGNLQEGASITVSVDAIPSSRFLGSIVEIVPSAEPLSHTFIVKICIDNDPKLRTGMFARALIPREPVELLLVPVEAIETRGQLEGLYVEMNDQPRFHLVRTGKRFENDVEILAGLTPGERYHPNAASAAAFIKTVSEKR